MKKPVLIECIIDSDNMATLSIRNKAFNYGLGCFEGIRAHWNEFKTTVYIRPLAYKSSTAISPTLSDNENDLIIYCQPLGRFTSKEELDVSVTSWKRVNNNMLARRTKATAPYLISALASLEANQNRYDESVFLTNEGNVCESPGENTFMVNCVLKDNIIEKSRDSTTESRLFSCLICSI